MSQTSGLMTFICLFVLLTTVLSFDVVLSQVRRPSHVNDLARVAQGLLLKQIEVLYESSVFFSFDFLLLNFCLNRRVSLWLAACISGAEMRS